MNIITIIELNNPIRILPIREATKEQIIEWINQAPTRENRQHRKQAMYIHLYSSGPLYLKSKDLGIQDAS